MSLKKRLICLVAAVLLVLPQLATVGQAAAPDAADDIAVLRLENAKENVFPNGWYWKGGDMESATRNPSGGNGNVFNRATQCHAFALKLASMLWDSYPTAMLSEYRDGLTDGKWTCYTRAARGYDGLTELGLKPGDIVRAGYGSSYANGHTAVVWKVEGDSVYFVEAWGSYSCRINWGGFNYYHYSLKSICSRYSQVAIWRYSDADGSDYELALPDVTLIADDWDGFVSDAGTGSGEPRVLVEK